MSPDQLALVRVSRHGQLEDGGRAAVTKDPVGRRRAADRDRGEPVVEEDQMEGESHSEGVDAATAWDQQPLAGAPRAKQRESQQAGDSSRGDGHRATGELDAPKAPDSKRLAASVHIPPNPGAPSCAPSRRAAVRPQLR